MAKERRIVSLVFPHLLCELAKLDRAENQSALGIVRLGEEEKEEQVDEGRKIDAIDENARGRGLRPGLTIAEARAFVADLEIRMVQRAQEREALERVAELCLGFGPSVMVELPDLVVVDVTGAGHLWGGEAGLLEQMQLQVEQLGHGVRLAVADGIGISSAVARYGGREREVVEAGRGGERMRELPIYAFPIDKERLAFLERVGLRTGAELAKLPRAELAGRLGERASEILGLLAGYDPKPLRLYEPPEQVIEHASWEEGVEDSTSLLFVLRRLAGNLSSRLQGRGLATLGLVLTLQYDRGIARLRGVENQKHIQMELSSALSHLEDLMRVIRTRLERTELGAPVLGISVEASRLTQGRRVQLDLSRDTSVSPDALAVLLAELSTEIGAERVGVLQLQSTHIPEKRSVLNPVVGIDNKRVPEEFKGDLGFNITRLLVQAQSWGSWDSFRKSIVKTEDFSSLKQGNKTSPVVASIDFELRLEGIEWWTEQPVRRDYMTAWMRQGEAWSRAWVYVERGSGEIFLHGWLD